MAIFSMGVYMTTNLKGDLPGYGAVWCHYVRITIILSLSKLADEYRVAYEINCEVKFPVYLPREEVKYFKQCNRGLFYSDMAE